MGGNPHVQASFLEMRKAPLSSVWGRQRCLKMSPWSCPWKNRMESRGDCPGRELRAHRRGLSTGMEEDVLLRVPRSQARGSGEVLGILAVMENHRQKPFYVGT